MNLVEYRLALWKDLKATLALWSGDEIDRCVVRAVGDLSRFLPLEVVYEHTLNFTVTAETSTSAAAGTAKALAYKPIKPETETITSDPVGTAYVRDTDYTMDYFNGTYTAITVANGGSIGDAGSTALLVSYTKSRLGIDISAIITSLIRVIDVGYPADKIPQQKVSYNIFGDFMYIGSQKVGESQTQLTDKEHVVIYYEKEHTPPTPTVDGSYQEYLDQVICIGAAAYALLMKALECDHQSVTDLASARTTLGNLTACHTLIVAALSKLTGIHTLANAALYRVGGYAAGAATALEAAITKMSAAISALNEVATYLTGATGSAKFWLDKATADIPAFSTAIAAANSYLDEVDTTDLQGAEGVWVEEVKHILTAADIPNAEDFLELGDDSIDVSAILTKVEAALDKIATEIAAGKTHLTTGESKINTVNVGDNVPELRRDYANVQVGIGAGYRQEGSERLAEATVQQRQAELYLRFAGAALEMARLRDSQRKDFLTEATARTTAAMGFVQEGATRLDAIRVYIEQARGYATISDGFIAEAESRMSIVRGYLAEADGRLGICNTFITEANSRMAEMDRYLGEVNGLVSRLNGYLGEAAQYAGLASSDRELADRFKAEGIERRNEFWSILRDKAEYRRRVSSTPVRQA